MSSSYSKFKKNAIIGLIASLLILFCINILSYFLYFRIDLTQDKRNSLSPATIKLLSSLDDKVYIKVYLKGNNLPADYQQFAKKTKDLLESFRNYSKNIHFEFIDPTAGKTKEELQAIYGEFNSKGLKPIPISREEGMGYSTQYVIPGAVVGYKSREFPATLVVADPSSGSSWLEYSIQELEYNFVNAIRKLMQPKKAKIAFIEGHGELDFLSTSWMHWQLQHFYDVERVTIEGRVNSLRDIEIADTLTQEIKVKGNKYDVLIIAQPTKPFSEFDKYIIDQHIMRGGKVLWLIDATTASIDSLQTGPELFAVPRNLRLENIFFKYGVRMNSNLIQDLSCQSIPIYVGKIGDSPQFKQILFPYAMDIVNFSDHPIVRKMKNIKSDFAGSIDFVGNSTGLNKIVLMTSSERTKLVPTPSIVTLNVARATPNIKEFMLQYLPVAVLVEGTFTSAYRGILPIEFDTIQQLGFIDESPPTRQIFVADGDIIRNYYDRDRGPYPCGYDKYTKRWYDNSDFILNCVNYLCADEDLLQIRSKNFKLGLLDPIKTKNIGTTRKYAILNLVFPLIIIGLIGTFLIVLRIFRYSKNAKTPRTNKNLKNEKK
ncbi:MAG TPA: gliding motility-associated ABC transporter substrate-binding protein GldG [Bacteroidales bacterium]|jgi:ABC-2 type transport system permease protein|nr:gliding motility-associated ABC transporter substrate-binding protein GldG [Bacteroidales bacterium]